MKINSKDTNNFKVCVVGSGRAAHFFAHRINHTSAAFELVGIVSRNMNMVSESLFPFSIYDYSCIPEADIFILAVPDDYIRTIAKQIPYAEALFLHCSGAQELITNTEQKHQGVLYPLLSLNFQMEFASNVPLFTETNSEYHKPILNQLAKQLNLQSSVIKNYESGKVIPNKTLLFKMGKILKVHLTGKNIGKPME